MEDQQEFQEEVLDFMGLGFCMPREAWRLPPPNLFTWGRNTAKQNATANSSPEDHTACGPVRAPAQGRQREEQAGPPPKKKQGGGGRENSSQAPNRPPTPPEAAKPPTQKAPKTGPPESHRGTTQPKPATPSQQQRPTGKRDTEKCRHTPREKKRASSPARKTGDGGTGTTRPRTGTPSNRHHKAIKQKRKKHTPTTQPRGRGTAETRAQHARPHRTPEQETAGGKRSAQKPHTSHKQAET